MEMEKDKDDQLHSLLDDDGRRAGDKKKDDDKLSNKLGYSRFMIEDVWTIGTKRLLKAKLKETRRGAKIRSDRKARINAAM